MNPSPQNAVAINRIMWFAVLTGASLAVAVLAVVRGMSPSFGEPRSAPLAWVAVAVAASGLIVSRAVARKALAPDPLERRRWMIVQMSACEVGALLGGVAWLVTGDPWSWVAAALGLLGIVLAFPRAPAPAGPRYMVR